LTELEGGNAVVVNENSESVSGQHLAKNTLLVPLMVFNELIGVIGIEQANSSNRWTDEEVDVASAAASRAALTLENARCWRKAKSAQSRNVRYSNPPHASYRAQHRKYPEHHRRGN